MKRESLTPKTPYLFVSPRSISLEMTVRCGMKRLKRHNSNHRNCRSCPKNSTHRASVPDHPHTTSASSLADHYYLSTLLVALVNIERHSRLTSIGISDFSTVRMGSPVLILEYGAVITD